MVEQGGLQPLITLAYAHDPDVHQQAAAALRGLSVSTANKMKVVQEGGLEPLTRLLASEDVEILREVCAALNNLSLGDENKFEIAKCGAVPPGAFEVASTPRVVRGATSPRGRIPRRRCDQFSDRLPELRRPADDPRRRCD